MLYVENENKIRYVLLLQALEESLHQLSDQTSSNGFESFIRSIFLAQIRYIREEPSPPRMTRNILVQLGESHIILNNSRQTDEPLDMPLHQNLLCALLENEEFFSLLLPFVLCFKQYVRRPTLRTSKQAPKSKL